MRELTGYAAHKTTDNTANERTDGNADALQELSALADEPGQTGELSQTADGGQNQSQLRNDGAHTDDANHSPRDKSGHALQRNHHNRQEADAGDTFQQGGRVDTGQGVNNTGEERHEQINRRFDELRQALCDAVDKLNQEQHERVHDLRSISHKRRENPGKEL